MGNDSTATNADGHGDDGWGGDLEIEENGMVDDECEFSNAVGGFEEYYQAGDDDVFDHANNGLRKPVCTMLSMFGCWLDSTFQLQSKLVKYPPPQHPPHNLANAITRCTSQCWGLWRTEEKKALCESQPSKLCDIIIVISGYAQSVTRIVMTMTNMISAT